MQVVRYSEYGEPKDVVRLIEEDTGAPEAGEIVVDIEAAPIHIADLKNLAGAPDFRFPLPATPGYEGIGRVARVGAGVAEHSVGGRVFLPLFCGAWRQQIKVNAADAMAAPDGDAVQLSLLTINPPTAQLILDDFADLKAGDWIIQNAANSSCGVYLIRLARMRGIKTVNVVRRRSLAGELKAAGADVVLVDGPGLSERVAEATGGAKIRLGIDAIAGAATARIADCLTDGGTVLAYGLLTGEPCQISPATLFLRGIDLRGFYTKRQMEKRTPAEQRKIYDGLAGFVADGALSAKIAATYALNDIAEAVDHAGRVAEARDGKIILLPNG